MLKRDLDFEITHICEVDPTLVKDELLKILNKNEEIEINNDRKNFATHSKTKSHLIYNFPLEWDGKSIINAEVSTNNLGMINAVEPLVRLLEEQYDGKRGRVLLVNLPAGEKIPMHQDSGIYLQLVHRNHIPIITNDKVMFGVGNTLISMKENNVYEINNHKTHYVNNDSDSDRYHLIIDIIPFELPIYETV
jgi:aspartyl/asparaginyl beta-hydroxylase (cupin superfamily)